MSSNKLNLHIRYAFPSSDISVENNTEAMRPIIEHPKLLQWGNKKQMLPANQIIFIACCYSAF